MGVHRTTVVPAATGWQGRCNCRQAGPITQDHWKAVNWGEKHIQQVERTKRLLEHRSMSLEKARDYYWDRANDETESEEHREQWRTMATELDHRIGPEKMEGEQPLF